MSIRAWLVSLVFIAAAAPPAAAQTQIQIDELRARQDAADRQAVARANELMALEARLQAERAVADLQAQRLGPALPSLPYQPASGATAAAALAKYPSIPDAELADSNRRVQDAARNRR